MVLFGEIEDDFLTPENSTSNIFNIPIKKTNFFIIKAKIYVGPFYKI